MDQNEFRSLSFAEARMRLLEEMGLLGIGIRECRVINCRDGTPTQLWPLRFGREG